MLADNYDVLKDIKFLNPTWNINETDQQDTFVRTDDIKILHPYWNTRFITSPVCGWEFTCPNCKNKIFTNTVSEPIECCMCNHKIMWEKIPAFDGKYKFYD